MKVSEMNEMFFDSDSFPQKSDSNAESTTATTSTTTTTTTATPTPEEANPQLENYLAKLIELVPDLKEIDREEKIKRILHSTSQTDAAATISQQLEGFQNLDLNSAKTISDLQILQSVLDYIRDLQSKIDLDSSY